LLIAFRLLANYRIYQVSGFAPYQHDLRRGLWLLLLPLLGGPQSVIQHLNCPLLTFERGLDMSEHDCIHDRLDFEFRELLLRYLYHLRWGFALKVPSGGLYQYLPYRSPLAKMGLIAGLESGINIPPNLPRSIRVFCWYLYHYWYFFLAAAIHLLPL
jgi:hypothetical protein